MSRSLVRAALAALVALVASIAASPARAAEPESKVTKFVLGLGDYFGADDTEAPKTINLLVKPDLPSWKIWVGHAKLVVPSCTVSLSGKLRIYVERTMNHESSMLHWRIDPIGGASVPLQGGISVGESHAFNVNLPAKLGSTMFNVTAWTSKNGEKSQVKGLLVTVSCEEWAPPTLKPGAASQLPAPAPTLPKVGVSGLAGVPLELRGVRVDLGLPATSTVEWFKGQPTAKDVLFHENASAPLGTLETVTAGGQTFQSRAVPSCRTALPLKRWLVRAKNTGTTSYPGIAVQDVKVTSSGPSGSSNSAGKMGAVAPNTEGVATIDAGNQGIVFFPSGTYAVNATMLPPATSGNPANDAASLALAFKCKAVGDTVWK